MLRMYGTSSQADSGSLNRERTSLQRWKYISARGMVLGLMPMVASLLDRTRTSRNNIIFVILFFFVYSPFYFIYTTFIPARPSGQGFLAVILWLGDGGGSILQAGLHCGGGVAGVVLWLWCCSSGIVMAAFFWFRHCRGSSGMKR